MDCMQHTMLPYPSPTPGTCSNSCPLSRWCYPTISSSLIPFSSCLQSFPASGSFLCFHVLAVINTAVTNIRVWIFSQIMFFFTLDKYPEGLLDHMVALFLNFWRTFLLFSIVASPNTFPPTTVERGCLFSTSAPTFVISCLYDNSHEVTSHCRFDLQFSDDYCC